MIDCSVPLNRRTVRFVNLVGGWRLLLELWVLRLGNLAGGCCECQKFMGSKGTNTAL